MDDSRLRVSNSAALPVVGESRGEYVFAPQCTNVTDRQDRQTDNGPIA